MDVPLLARPVGSDNCAVGDGEGSLELPGGTDTTDVPVGGFGLSYSPGDAEALRERCLDQCNTRHSLMCTREGTRFQMGNLKSSSCGGVRDACKQWAEWCLVTAAVYFNVTLTMLSVKLPPPSVRSISLLTPPWHGGVWFSEAVVLNDGASEIQSDGSVEYWGRIFWLFASPQKDQSPICSIFCWRHYFVWGGK